MCNLRGVICALISLVQFLYILSTINWFPLKSPTSKRFVFSPCQFWYLLMFLYSILVQGQSINLLLVSSKQEEQLFLIHCQFLYILSTMYWLSPKSPTRTWYVFSLCQYWYPLMLLYSILVQGQSIYYQFNSCTYTVIIPTLWFDFCSGWNHWYMKFLLLLSNINMYFLNDWWYDVNWFSIHC